MLRFALAHRRGIWHRSGSHHPSITLEPAVFYEGAGPAAVYALRIALFHHNQQGGETLGLELYRDIADLIPNDRVSRHRIVRELLREGRIGDAEVELRRAVSEVRMDPPLQRYRVLLELERSRDPRLLENDRRAILNVATNEAEEGVRRYPGSKYLYFVLADVAEEWYERFGDYGKVVWAKSILETGREKLLDPEFEERIRRLPS